jgi:hypothetical protein
VPLLIDGEDLEGQCLHCHLEEDIPKYANKSTRGTSRTSCITLLGMSIFMGTSHGSSSLGNSVGSSKRLVHLPYFFLLPSKLTGSVHLSHVAGVTIMISHDKNWQEVAQPFVLLDKFATDWYTFMTQFDHDG